MGHREHRHGPVSLARTKDEGRMSEMEFMLALLLHSIVSARGFESRPNVRPEKPSLVDRKGAGVGAEDQTAPDFRITGLNGRRVCLSSLRGKFVMINPLDQLVSVLC